MSRLTLLRLAPDHDPQHDLDAGALRAFASLGSQKILCAVMIVVSAVP
jgi:hypothetical protein